MDTDVTTRRRRRDTEEMNDDGDADDAREEEEEEPTRLTCPITKCVFRDPVFVPGSGNTYEREALETFWNRTAAGNASRARDPLTNEILASKSVYTNWDKRREVSEWLDANPTRTPSGWTTREVPAPKKDRDGPERRSDGSVGRGRGRGGAGRLGFGRNALLKTSALVTVFALGYAGYAGFVGSKPNSGTRGAPRLPSIDEFGGHVTRVDPPAGSRIGVRLASDSDGMSALEITFPSASVDMASLLFSIPWFAITGTWTYGAMNAANPIFASFSLPFWAVGFNMIHQGATTVFENTKLLVTPRRFYLEKTIFDRRMFYLKGDTKDLSKAALETYAYVNGHPQNNLVLHHGVKSHVLQRGLHPSENDFVVNILDKFLKKHRKTRSSSQVKIDTATPYFAKARL